MVKKKEHNNLIDKIKIIMLGNKNTEIKEVPEAEEDYTKEILLTEENKKLIRSVHAIELRDNPLLKEILTELKNDLMIQWRNSKLENVSDRESIYLAYKIIEIFETKIASLIAEGEYIKKKMDMEEKLNATR